MDNLLVSGLGQLVNKDYVSTGVDIKQLEDDFIKKGVISAKQATDSVVDKVKMELDKIMEGIGEEPIPPEPSEIYNGGNVGTSSMAGPAPVLPSRSCREGDRSPPSGYATHDERDSLLRSEPVYVPTPPSSYRLQAERVLNSLRPDMNIDEEMMETARNRKIEEIDYLQQVLLEARISVQKYQTEQLEQMTDLDLDRLLDRLKHKYNLYNRSSMFNEFALTMIHKLGNTYDGTKEVMFGWKPRFTGWDKHAQVRLGRLRYSTAPLMEKLLNSLGIGETGEVVFSLVTNGLAYSCAEHSTPPPGYNSKDDMERLSGK